MVICVEYRIPLPLTADEYRIAQLYMLSKKSRQESEGEGSGIEILVNEPYDDGPGPNGCGQYTRKLYHVGSHLPVWLKSLIPKSALTVEEEAWNAYPYTKTRFTCPFIDRFSIEVETYYFDDGGHQDNVFQLSKSELKQRAVDVIDIVKDQLSAHDYTDEEDPTKFVSDKTARGPLTENWIEEYWAECKGKDTPLANGKAIMCAYKLCKVEFRYWGMQSKLEKFIHDVALRKTMLRAHRQAWAWMDEWWGLSIEDIRNIEKETQELLAKQFGAPAEGADEDTPQNVDPEPQAPSPSARLSSTSSLVDAFEPPDEGKRHRKSDALEPPEGFTNDDIRKRNSWTKSGSRSTLNSHSHVSWRMESIRRDSGSSASDDEFFDCQATVVPSIKEESEANLSLQKWSSLEILPQEDIHCACAPGMNDIFAPELRPRASSERRRGPDSSMPPSPSLSPSHIPCATSILILVVHAGCVLDAASETATKRSDVTTFRGAFESVVRQHYPNLIGRVAIRLVAAPPIFTGSLTVLSSLSPFGIEARILGDPSTDQVPVGAVPILGTLSPEYEESISKLISSLNGSFHDFSQSDEGFGFNGQTCIIGDSVGGVMCYDALIRNADGHAHMSADAEAPPTGDENDVRACRKSVGDVTVCGEAPPPCGRSISDSDYHYPRHLNPPCTRRRSSGSTCDRNSDRIDFEVCDFFLFGCPLSLVLVYRKMMNLQDKSGSIPRPACHQMYNLFHPTDPIAVRLEPLISARFALLPAVTIPRYTKYPLGDGQPTLLMECIQANGALFMDEKKGVSSPPLSGIRRISDASIMSTMSGGADTVPMATINTLSKRWWGRKRLDYALYCPDGLSNFPSNSLPHLFHASYWESPDVVAFVLRQLVRVGTETTTAEGRELSVFLPTQPREKWLRKRTSVKIKNIAANHRGKDIIINEGAQQELQARFLYGPLDMVALSGEKVDIHVMREPPSGDWEFMCTAVTEKNGKIGISLPQDKRLPYGMFPVKMIVRGDHTACSMYIAVVPPQTECVVFSIDGSFTASVSVSGKDPKVRAGAVDVVRHWQELGYLIIYMTGRPDMQQQKVVAWLAQHNFPHGLVSFADGLSTDPLGHKTDFLKKIKQESSVLIEAAYGSAKDISVYSCIGLKPEQIYIVGKASKKNQPHCQVLSDGYAAHLATLSALGKSRPARGNPQMIIPKGFFGLPGHSNALRRRSSVPLLRHNVNKLVKNILDYWKLRTGLIKQSTTINRPREPRLTL